MVQWAAAVVDEEPSMLYPLPHNDPYFWMRLMEFTSDQLPSRLSERYRIGGPVCFVQRVIPHADLGHFSGSGRRSNFFATV